ncbi:hypothetical protein P3T76_014839 [Phytophthora citrophthora]|uniref:Uncharacterized protein n=1 Tax=Phytophthora citrophthora TaxID=4793 RepID=A0AAD9G189_9STRA|nr:hypothetical protein P3T76_014839 [Phytophthora citrophthora]
MIRPVSHQQMQLQSPRKPRVNTSAPNPLASPKSPIKKHLQNASTFASEAPSTGPSELDRSTPLKAKLRASVLQSVLKLLDQDVNTLVGAQEVLQAAAALPLAEPNVQRACLQALRDLHKPSGPSSLNCDAYENAIPPASPRKLKALQQARSNSLTSNSLHHCKEFLLACANEIHELEDVRPLTFDYAEDTSSLGSQSEKKCKQCGAENFDYASTVESSDAFGSEISGFEDDTRADQGSQFSEVLHRAEYMSEVDEDEAFRMSNSERTACRQVLRALNEYVQSQRRRSSAPNLVTKFRVFEALKLQASLTRKRLAFQTLKSGLRSSKPKALVKREQYGVTFRVLMLHHSDVLLLLLALVFLAHLPAKYIM